MGYIFRWLWFEFADGTMTSRGDCGSGALAEESPRMTPAYEDGKGKMRSAATSSDSDSSILADRTITHNDEHITPHDDA